MSATKQSFTLPSNTLRDESVQTWRELESPLTVVLLYEDALTRRWTQEVCELVERLAGRERVEWRSWGLSDLSESKVLAEACQVTVRADLIVVSVYAAQNLPLNLYLWVEAWLPRRLHVRAALLSLITMGTSAGARCHHAQNYLEAVANRTGLDFLMEERDLLLEPLSNYPGKFMNKVSVDHVPGHRQNYDHWGLNE
jgi:hypothetical protein